MKMVINMLPGFGFGLEDQNLGPFIVIKYIQNMSIRKVVILFYDEKKSSERFG